MYTKEEIINGMCTTYRHDYPFISESDRRGIRAMMEQLFEHNFKPVLEDVYDDARCACPQCMHVVADTIGKALGRNKSS